MPDRRLSALVILKVKVPFSKWCFSFIGLKIGGKFDGTSRKTRPSLAIEIVGFFGLSLRPDGEHISDKSYIHLLGLTPEMVALATTSFGD